MQRKFDKNIVYAFPWQSLRLCEGIIYRSESALNYDLNLLEEYEQHHY